MTDGAEFPTGKAIWPAMYAHGGNADDDRKKTIEDLVTEFAEYVAEALEELGLPKFTFPLFRPFNAVFALTPDQFLCVSSPLSGGVAVLRFLDSREPLAPKMTLDELAAAVRDGLGWQNLSGFALPGGVIDSSGPARVANLRREAVDLASKIRARLERQGHRVQMQPIFRTKPDDMEMDDSLCFVLMPFAPPFDRLYNEVIKLAVEQAGLHALRADEIFHPTPIVEDVWVHIATSRLIIADVTGKNPNVFYELGLAHAVGKPVIIITQSKDSVPFDISYIRYFLYADDQAGWARLREDLGEAIRATLDVPGRS